MTLKHEIIYLTDKLSKEREANRNLHQQLSVAKEELEANQTLRKELDEFKAKLAELEKAFLKYGGHFAHCKVLNSPIEKLFIEGKPMPTCDCGYDEAKDQLRKQIGSPSP